MNTLNYRLSESVNPSHYDIVLRPDIENATFSGSVVISANIESQSSEIRLNCIDLVITSAKFISNSVEAFASVTYDSENEMISLSIGQPLEAGLLEIAIDFEGVLNDLLVGFYRSTYTDASGKVIYLATTQFEATDARRAFPCFDEPDKKAVFAIALEVDQDHLAISNGAQISSELLGNGKKLVRFEPTIPMSTYLVAFIVGPLVASDERIACGTPIRIIHRPDWEHLTGFALDAAVHAVEFLTDFFQIPYPGTKLDLIAIPDFGAGAMENLGAVTFREALLLVDPSSASQPERERIVDVISHEIAHMWFGDLVTMKWWNGIWLNEAFATYMETLTTDHFEPSWKKWTSFGVYRAAAQATDSLHSTRPIEYPVFHPSDCRAMFDILTYEKGGSVLRMLELHLGTEKYRLGISHYLNKYRYSNAETTDLWDALEEVTHEPVRALMDTWVFQGGFPLVSVAASNESIILSQEPFSFLSSRPANSAIGSNWIIPVAVRKVKSLESTRSFLLLDQPQEIASRDSGTWVVNAHGHGYFRVHYSDEILAEILEHFDELDDLEQFNLISDSWAMVVANRASFESFISIAEAIAKGGYLEPSSWSIVAQGLDAAAKARGEGGSAGIYQLAQRLFSPLIETLGTIPVDNEPETNGVLRSLALSILGTLVRDKEVIEHARDQFRAEMSGERSIEPSLASSILHTVAANGDEADYAFVLDRFRHPKSPVDEQRFLGALSGFENVSLVSRTLAMCLDGIRNQDAPYTIAKLLRSPASQEIAFDFLVANYEILYEKFPSSTISRMLDAVTGLYSPAMVEKADRVRGFLASAKIPESGKKLDQIRERLEVNLALARNLRS